MARPPKILDRMRRTREGWGQSDFFPVLEYYGYELVRHANHGAIYRHPDLARHPDLHVRTTVAQVMIPKGTQLRGYVADAVVASIDFLLLYQQNPGETPRANDS